MSYLNISSINNTDKPLVEIEEVEVEDVNNLPKMIFIIVKLILLVFFLTKGIYSYIIKKDKNRVSVISLYVFYYFIIIALVVQELYTHNTFVTYIYLFLTSLADNITLLMFN